jgi:hypothetical protein
MSDAANDRLTRFNESVAVYGKEFSELMDKDKLPEAVPEFALLALRGGRCGLAKLVESEETALDYLGKNGDLMTQVRLVNLDSGETMRLERTWVAEVGREL